MVLITEVVHPGSLDFSNQRKVVLNRDIHKMTFRSIAKLVLNVSGKKPTARTVANTYRAFNKKCGHRKFHYQNCGRKPWKLSKLMQEFLVRRLLRLRQTTICTSSTLQRTLARERGVLVHVVTIQKMLKRLGYKWLPRAQKRKYSEADMAKRKAFAERLLALRPAQLRAELSMAMDGVVLTIPPSDAIGRINFCKAGETHMWRTKKEHVKLASVHMHRSAPRDHVQ